MRKVLTTLFLFSTLAFTQECPTIYGAFAGYSPNASPKVTGGGLVASLFPGMKCDPSIPQFHTYTQYIESPIKIDGVWTLQQTISTGAALPIYKLPFGQFWALGTLGAKIVGNTSSVGLGSTYGGGISIPVKNRFQLFPAFEKINGQSQFLIAFLF